MNLGDILKKSVTCFPNECAMIFDRQCYSFLQVDRAVRHLSGFFSDAQIVPGDRVALLISNSPAFSIAYFATLWNGAVVVPVNPLLSDRELTRILEDCRPALLCFEKPFAKRVQKLLAKLTGPAAFELPSDPVGGLDRGSPVSGPVAPHGPAGKEMRRPLKDTSDQTAVILYTSGTTGQPKGVKLTHRNLYTNARSVSREKFSTPAQLNILGPGHAGLASLPLTHAFGQTNLQNGIWFGGAAIVYQRKFDGREALELMASHSITFFAGVPTMITELIQAGKEKLPEGLKLKYCVCGGAALASPVKQEFRRIFEVEIQESYGLSETSPMISCQRLDQATKAGVVGKPIAGVSVCIIDEKFQVLTRGQKGEILVKGPNVFEGYFRQDEQTNLVFTNGWFRTGDIGEWDADGDLLIVDRIKEIIIRGGYTIYPREIENVLLEDDRVQEAAVVGIPDEKYGEKIGAFVTLTADYDSSQINVEPEPDVTEVIAQIKSDCKKKLAAYKCPQFIEIIDAMPKGSTGKVDRKQLKRLSC